MRMKMRMRCMSLFLMVCVMATSIPEIAFASETGQNVENQSGDGMTWELSEDGTLTIRGEGEIYNGGWDTTKVKSVVVEEGLTSIGYEAFKNCVGITSISLPEGLASIGGSAFSGRSGLTNGVVRIESTAFSGCILLTNVRLPEGLEEVRHLPPTMKRQARR